MLTTGSVENFQIRPYAGAVGARIEGLRLVELTPGSDPARMVNQALWDYGMLVVGQQFLTPAGLVAVTRLFGEPMVHPLVPHHPDHPEVIVIDSQERRSRGRTDFWHADATFSPTPPIITLLQSEIIPAAGGDTMFANQALALQGMSPALRRMLAPLRAVHSSDELATAVGRSSDISVISHPVIRRHDETGVSALYVNAGFTRHFEGMTVAESQPLLRHLYEVAAAPEIGCRHTWTLGDLLIWDNRLVQHYAVPDYRDDHRRMIRTVVAGSVPIAASLEDL
ncbi:MAG TPA: TauD/TfdA family dioxygenase [Jatrophihabitans sp.]|nr:TauD/TfdA family dioxygenase [Jatrophihabitans sp.]